MGRQLNAPIPSDDLVNRYIELGGELFVLGSDAHNSGDIAGGFDKAIDFLKHTGIRYATYFSNRTANLYPI
ncbi:histidinol-phosphatase [compost metagenome]